MLSPRRIFVAGHQGMVGSAVVRQLEKDDNNILLLKNRRQLDLTDQMALKKFFQQNQIDEIYLCAARVGGIHANSTYPADFIYSNLVIEANVIHQAHAAGIHKLLFLGSSCIYPKLCPQPMPESALLSGPLEPTNEPYAIAKIAGIKLCESYNHQHGTDYRSVMPTNLYGRNDNFHPKNSHVVPALMRRFHQATLDQAKADKEASVVVWGSGNVYREFMFVDDMAQACVFVMNLPLEKLNSAVSPSQSHLNIGTGQDISIKHLARTMAKVVGFSGDIAFDRGKPDGPPRKLLDVSVLAKLGWTYQTELEPGLTATYQWYRENLDSIRGV